MRIRSGTSSDSRRSSSSFSLTRTRSRWPVPGISPVRCPPTKMSPFHFGSLLAGVERHAGQRNGRHPVDDRRFEAFLRKRRRLPRSRVAAAEAHDRPAVVGARLQDVDFVAAVRSHFVLPHLAGRRMHGEAERVAVAERVDLRLVSGASDERVVRRHGAIVIEAQHLARVAVRILRAAAVAAARRRHIELAVAAPREPRRPADARAATEDVLEFGDRGSVEAAASDGQRRLPLGSPTGFRYEK